MNTRAEDFSGYDSEKGTTRAEYPTTIQLMNGVYKRRVQLRPSIEAITDISSGESPASISDYTSTPISPAKPDAKQFGFWLKRYRNQVQHYTEEYFETSASSGSKLRRLYENSLPVRRKNKNQAAIDLLQSWIDEGPDDQQAVDLIRMKETIDEQRTEERKLFK